MDPSEQSATGDREPYRELFERSADAILIIEGETFVDCNDATVRLLRYESREHVLQTHPSELSPPYQPDGRQSFEKANEMIALAFERGSHRFEWNHVRADGEVFPVEVLLTAVAEPGRRTLHVVWRDITERKRLEEELRQAQKMEAIGKLTGGIAHDFNNLLVAVIGHSDLLEPMLEDQPAALDHVRGIRHAGESAAGLVRQLLAFGRKQRLRPAPLDLNELVLATSTLLERVIGEEIVLLASLADEPVPIKADLGQLEQVLLNLAANARDAMPSGGELTIETARVRQVRKGGDLGAEVPQGDYGRLLVTDTGTGMNATTIESAFDPFFTTKDASYGSGLGLATVYGIVKQSGGTVSLCSAPGEGTRVEILLPLTAESIPEVESTPDERRHGDPVVGSETILVVEDEDAVARLVARSLESHGYRVISCHDGLAAVELFQEREHEIELIVCDVIMPRLGGAGMVIELRALGYEPRVLFMSGYTGDALTGLNELNHEVDLLQKPFTVGELVRRVRRALGPK